MSTLLETIQSPQDLRKLTIEQLPQVCRDIRDFIIANLSQHPGHFASSMGAVEITVALHYVFNTPYDRIVWDVGHQAYGHKILTGRRDQFPSLRTLGGLSGFPNPDESEYDTFATGHASNSISAALGMAVASTLKNEEPQRKVVAVIGDASISGGLAFEGLNNAANTNADLLIILNDNDMSIDRNVGSLNSYLAHFTISPAYNKLRYNVYNFLRHLHMVTPALRGKILRFNNSLKAFILSQQNIFEGLNLRYFGPFDGHDVQRIVAVLNDIKNMHGPRLLHLRTVKGKGFEAAEKDPSTWHAPGKFDPVTGQRIKGTTSSEPKFQNVFGSKLVELAKSDPSVVAVTAAMPSGTSASMMMEAFPDRAFDVGIAEGHAVTFAGGLAREGMKPFVVIYSTFLQRAYDHIVNDVSLCRFPVVFCIDRAGLVGEDGPTHHGALDFAYMHSVPGMVVSAPRDRLRLQELMDLAMGYSEGPISIRYPRGSGNVPIPNTTVSRTIGKGDKLLDSTNPKAVILTIGVTAYDALEAASILVEKGIPVVIYDLVFLKPIDEEILKEAASYNCPIVTVEDGSVVSGFGSAVSQWLTSQGLSRQLTSLGIPDQFVEHGTREQLKAICGFDSKGIAQTVEKIVSKS